MEVVLLTYLSITHAGSLPQQFVVAIYSTLSPTTSSPMSIVVRLERSEWQLLNFANLFHQQLRPFRLCFPAKTLADLTHTFLLQML